jgi:uncharacterized membrane-anchored protein YitT (DUF2179 family)
VAVTIISNGSDELGRRIISDTGCGVTFLEGRGGYSQTGKQVILSIAARSELPRLKALISKVDPEAFVIVNDTHEVMGKGHGALRTY